MNKPKTFPKTHRRATLKSKRRCSQLLTLAGRVCSIDLTPLGHVSCVLDTPAGRLKALSDAACVHLPQLRPGRSMRVVLLRLRRETPYGSWDWQLLACRGLEGSDLADTKLHLEGTPT